MNFFEELKYQIGSLLGIAAKKYLSGFRYFKCNSFLLVCLWTGIFCLCTLGYKAEAQEFPQWQAEQNNLPGGAVRVVNLSSGVKAFIQRVPNSEAAGVCLSVKAGSKLDTKGSWGRAHFLEHLLFRRTAAFSGGKLTVSLENVGADRGANTTESCINFWEVVPQNALDLTLQIEADRLSGVVFTQNELEMERKLLLGELSKLRANPWRLVQQYLLSNLYPHLSEGELIPDGDAEDLKNITAKELVDFYKHSFVPNRACVYLITSEPFNLAAAGLERHFGKNLLKKRKIWEEQSEAVYQKQKEAPQNYTTKAASSKELLSLAKVKACTDKSGQGLAVLAWPAPQLNSADYAHWLVLNILWADSSEAYLQKVLRDHGLASKVTLNYDIDFGDSLYVVGAHCTPEVDPQEVARLLEEAVTAPVDDNFVANRLEAAKGRATAHFYQLWQNYRDRLSLYQSLSVGKGNETIASIPEAISQVRAENICSLWRKLALKEPKKFISDKAHFWSNFEASPGPRTVFAEAENSESDSKDKSFSNNNIREKAANSAAQHFKLANEISWQVWTDNSLPIVVMRGFLSFPQNGNSDVFRAAAGMLGRHFIKEGDVSMPFAEVIEREGISLSFQQRYNGVVINGWCLRTQLPRFLELLNSVFEDPQFERSEIDRALARYKRSNISFESNDWNRALNIFTTQIGSASSKKSEQSNHSELEREELWQNWRLLTNPTNLSLSFSGCVQVKELQKMCNFGIFAQELNSVGATNIEKYGTVTVSSATQTKKIFTEGKQSGVLILAGQAGPSANHPDYFAYNVILQILGGNSSARLPLRIVHLEKLGSSAVTYDLASGVGCPAWLAVIRTKEGGQGRALAILRQELQRLTSGLSQAELKRAVSACKGKLQVAWSNPAGKAEWLRCHEGRPESVSAPEDYLAAYDKVSLHDIRRVAKTWFNGQTLTIVFSQKKSSAGQDHKAS